MILDARTKHKNVPNVHTITTRKFKRGGDELSHLVESPVFGHSDAHVVLQLADIVASALLFPLACTAYCGDLDDNLHLRSGYEQLRDRYGGPLRGLEHRYVDADGRKRGGVKVTDGRNRRPSLDLFQAPAQLAGLGRVMLSGPGEQERPNQMAVVMDDSFIRW